MTTEIEEVVYERGASSHDLVIPREQNCRSIPGPLVSLKNLFDYLAGGHNLEEFLYDFPGVTREQAVRVLDMAGEVLESVAYETVARLTGAKTVKIEV